MTGNYPEEASAEVAEIYFRGAKGLARRPVDDIFRLLGKPRDYDDWDLGWLVYNWHSAARCVRIYTSHDRVDAVHLMEPVHTPRFGAALEVIWTRPDGQ